MFSQFLNYLDITSILVFLIVFFLSVYIWDTIYHSKVNIPGPTPWPILGNLPLFFGRKDPNKVFMELRDRYGNIVYITMGSQPLVLCYGYKVVHDVLVKNSEKTKHRPTWLPVFSKLIESTSGGVVFSNGKVWHDGRKFTQVALKDFGVGTKSTEEIIHEEIRYLCNLLSTHHGHPVDVSEYFSKAASNVVSNVVFGSRFDYEDPDLERLIKDVEFVIENNLLLRADNFFPFLECFYGKVENVGKHLADAKNFVEARLDKHRETFDPTIIRNFLDLYLAQEGKENSKISEQFLLATILDLYFAGTDTSSVIMQWNMLYMIKYPDVQKRCRDEILETIGDSRLPKLSDRDKLPYVNATMHEIQRIQTPAPVSVPHATLEDSYICGKFVPKQTILLCDLMSVHMDPTVWDEPEVFRPERFIDENGQFRNNEAFCSFSMGPRQCLGKPLGEAETFLFFVGLLQRFILTKAKPDQVLSTTGIQTFATLNPEPFEMCFNPVK